MNILQPSDINNINSNVYNLATKAKLQSSLSTAFQTIDGNTVNSEDIIKPINIENIRTAIHKLESSFSSNCCQSNCNVTSTKCQTTVCQYTTCQTISTSCQSCQKYYYYK